MIDEVKVRARKSAKLFSVVLNYQLPSTFINSTVTIINIIVNVYPLKDVRKRYPVVEERVRLKILERRHRAG